MAMRHRIIVLTLTTLFAGAGLHRLLMSPLSISSSQGLGPQPRVESQAPTGPRSPASRTDPGFRDNPNLGGARRSPLEESIHRLQGESKRAWKVRTDSDGEYIRTLSVGMMELQGKDIGEGGRWFLNKYSEALFGVKAEDLRLVSQTDDGLERVVFAQYHQGIPVLGGQISLLFRNRNLTRVQSDLSPWSPSAQFPPSADETRVRQSIIQLADQLLALNSLSAAQAHRLGKPSEIFFPSQGGLVPAYQMDVSEDNENSPTLITVWVDANTQRMLHWKKALIQN